MRLEKEHIEKFFNLADCPSIIVTKDNFKDIGSDDWVKLDGWDSYYQVIYRTVHKLTLRDFYFNESSSVEQVDVKSFIPLQTVHTCKTIFKNGFENKSNSLFNSIIHPSSEIPVLNSNIFNKISIGDFVRQKGNSNYNCVIGVGTNIFFSKVLILEYSRKEVKYSEIDSYIQGNVKRAYEKIFEKGNRLSQKFLDDENEYD